MKQKNTKQKGFNCPICGQLWKRGQSSVQCDLCSCWIHGPNDDNRKSKYKNCSLLSLNEFKTLTDYSDKSWVCSKCLNQNLPFFSENPNELLLHSLGDYADVTEDFQLIPNNKLKHFIDECNSLVVETSDKFDENIDEYELPSTVNSNYYSYTDFNKIKTDEKSTFSIMHTNLASIGKHFGDLSVSLSLLNHTFDIIGITEHKIGMESGPSTNIDIPGYHSFLFDPITTSHGGAGLYIKNSFVFIERRDLQFNSPGNHESLFIEIIFPNKKT